MPETEIMQRGWALVWGIAQRHPGTAPVQIALQRGFQLP